MARTKPKAKAIVAGDFTDTLRAGRGFTDTRAVQMPDERDYKAKNTRLRQSRVVNWRQHGWATDDELDSIFKFELAVDGSCYGSVRSSCDMSVRGGGEGMPPHVVIARADFRAAAAWVSRFDLDGGALSLMLVIEMLADEGDPDECRKRLFGGSRDSQVVRAKAAVKLVGRELVAHYERVRLHGAEMRRQFAA